MILDTNIYTALKLANPKVVSLVGQADIIQLPFIVVAELKYGFLNGTHTAINQGALDKFLAQPFVKLLLSTLQTCDLYAKFELHARRNGRALSYNDIWIAALTAEAGDSLVTYDQDFEVFRDELGSKLIVLKHG